MGNFSFSHSVFKRLVSQGRQKVLLCGNGFKDLQEKHSSLGSLKIVIVWSSLQILTLYQTSPGFYVSAVKSLLKTLWEKEKLLVRSNFSFSHIFFYLLQKLSDIFTKVEIVVCKLFQFERV